MLEMPNNVLVNTKTLDLNSVLNVQENFSQDNCDNLEKMSDKIKDHLNYLIENKDYLKGMVEDEQILKAKIIENKINKIKSLIDYQEEKGLNKV